MVHTSYCVCAVRGTDNVDDDGRPGDDGDMVAIIR